ncbi:unnamed protein product [Caenorhabditis brenneri]
MVSIGMEVVKALYIILLFIWLGFFMILIASLIREWFFPEPKHFEQFEEEKDYVPPPPKFVSLDVSQLEKFHGLKAVVEHEDTSDKAPLLGY